MKRILGLLWGLLAAGASAVAEKARVGAYGAWNWSEARPGTYAVTAQAYRDGALVGETLDDVTKDTDRDHFMSASEAKDWGIVDKVL